MFWRNIKAGCGRQRVMGQDFTRSGQGKTFCCDVWAETLRKGMSPAGKGNSKCRGPGWEPAWVTEGHQAGQAGRVEWAEKVGGDVVRGGAIQGLAGLDFTLFTSGTRGNETGRRNKAGLWLSTLPTTKRLPSVIKRFAVNGFLVFPLMFA